MEQRKKVVEVSASTKFLGVLGTPINHSKSPQMHNACFKALGLDYTYLAFDVGPENLEKAVEGLRVLGAKGFSVTMPNKGIITPYLDSLSEEVELGRTVNCVVNEDGKLIGYNTDGYGYVRTLEAQGIKVQGTKMTLIGTGGVSSAICTQCALDGMKEIALFGIKDATFDAGIQLVDRLNKATNCQVHIHELSDIETLRKHIKESDILTNATPVGMGKLTGKSPVEEWDVLRAGLTVMDVIYNPSKTRLLEYAEKQGCKIINGKEMLLWQGYKSFQLWTGKEMPVEAARPFV